MAGVVDHDTAAVIKKEIEDVVESPEQTDVQDSPQNQSEANGSQKQTKVWSEDETRSMIELHKSYMHRFKDGNYSKRQLLEDVAQELNLIGYDTTPEKVRNKMKYLRTRYKGIMDYNAKHVSQKEVPFQDELTELYTMESYDDQDPLLSKEMNGNESSDISFTSNSSEKPSKRAKLIPASHVDLQSVVTKKKNNAISKVSKVVKRKMPPKRSGQPLYQCGLCMTKFRTSSDMHDHHCKTPLVNSSIKKKAAPNSAQHSLTLWLKPTGNAPIVKNKKWTVEKKQTIAMIMVFLKKYMNLEPSASMFLYVNQSFAPSPDIEVGSIYDCFNINGKLVLHYSTSPAWG